MRRQRPSAVSELGARSGHRQPREPRKGREDLRSRPDCRQAAAPGTLRQRADHAGEVGPWRRSGKRSGGGKHFPLQEGHVRLQPPAEPYAADQQRPSKCGTKD